MMYLSFYEISSSVREYKKAVLERLYYFAPCGSKESAFLDYLLTVFQVLKVSESKTNRNMDLDLKALWLTWRERTGTWDKRFGRKLNKWWPTRKTRRSKRGFKKKDWHISLISSGIIISYMKHTLVRLTREKTQLNCDSLDLPQLVSCVVSNQGFSIFTAWSPSAFIACKLLLGLKTKTTTTKPEGKQQRTKNRWNHRYYSVYNLGILTLS